jgi:hypothetical protein
MLDPIQGKFDAASNLGNGSSYRKFRIRNKAKLRPFDLVDPRNTELRSALQRAEYGMQAGDDIIDEDDDGPTGSGSESD